MTPLRQRWLRDRVPAPRSAVTRRWLLFALYGALIVLGTGLARHLLEMAWPHLHPAQGASPRWMIAAAIAVYAVVMALPFMPAAEIGLALLLIFGPIAKLVDRRRIALGVEPA